MFVGQFPSMEIRSYWFLQWMARLLRCLAYCIDGQHPVQLEQDDHEALQDDLNTLTQPIRPLPIEEPVVTLGILPPPPGLPAFPPIRTDARALVHLLCRSTPEVLEQDDHEASPIRPLPIEMPVVTAGMLSSLPGLPDFRPIRPNARAQVPQSDQSGARGTWPSFPDPPPMSKVWVRQPDILNRTGNFHLFTNCPAILGMPAILTTLQMQFVHHQTICQHCVMQTYAQRGLPGC